MCSNCLSVNNQGHAFRSLFVAGARASSPLGFHITIKRNECLIAVSFNGTFFEVASDLMLSFANGLIKMFSFSTHDVIWYFINFQLW